MNHSNPSKSASQKKVNFTANKAISLDGEIFESGKLSAIQKSQNQDPLNNGYYNNDPQGFKIVNPSEDEEKAYVEGLELLRAGSHQEAQHVFYNAAVHGHVESQYMLGVLFYEGEGILSTLQSYIVEEKDCNWREAMKWFSKAAVQGHADAQFMLAVSYIEHYPIHLGLQRNEYLNIEHSDAGQPSLFSKIASKWFGNVYFFKTDTGESLRWFNKSNKQGYTYVRYTDIQFLLMKLYAGVTCRESAVIRDSARDLWSYDLSTEKKTLITFATKYWQRIVYSLPILWGACLLICHSYTSFQIFGVLVCITTLWRTLAWRDIYQQDRSTDEYIEIAKRSIGDRWMLLPYGLVLAYLTFSIFKYIDSLPSQWIEDWSEKLWRQICTLVVGLSFCLSLSLIGSGVYSVFKDVTNWINKMVLKGSHD